MNQAMTKQKGFNLIEVLIGLAIGLIGLLAVAQVFVTFNKQRNTATQTMEAQSNGAMALYLIERDLEMSGYGLMNIQNCALIQWYWNPPGCTGAACGYQGPPNGAGLLSTMPVAITDGGASSDAVEINYGQSRSAAPGALVTQDQPTWGDEYHVASTSGYAIGDMIVADVSGSNSCTMSQVTSRDFNALTVQHVTTSEYNPAAVPPAGAPAGWEVAKISDLLVNLGAYVSKRYRVSGNTLQLAVFPQTATFNTVVDGIMFMKLQYGLDDGSNTGTADDGIVDGWVSGATAITNTKRVLAVRVGIVARSPLQEKEAVDAPTTLTVLPPATCLVAGVPVACGAAVTWNVPDDHYRYKVYNTLIPLRNVIWGRA